jgi:3'(2'), 5'-bisphosphate nucleotidase
LERNRLDNLGEIAGYIETLLKRCGELLQSLPDSQKKDGYWIDGQFKAYGDNLAHAYFFRSLRERFPNIPIVSEEDCGELLEEGTAEYFIVDPIDGTASFAEGFPGWVCQIAYVQNNKPQVAGIYSPVLRQYFSAIYKGGAFLNGNRLDLSGSESKLLTVIDNYPEPTGITRLACEKYRVSNYIESGSIGLKICRVAQGIADLFLKDMTPRDWDLAAPMLVLQEAGGQLSDLCGNQIILGLAGRRHNGLIACNNLTLLERVTRDFCAYR